MTNGLVINGKVSLRKTHPNLYRTLLTFAGIFIAQGLNFWLLAPTFLIYGQSNYLWGTIFLVLGAFKVFFLIFDRRLKALRAVMAVAIGYLLFLGPGTMQPFFEGNGSLQLPIFYLGCAAVQIPLLLEPFINPWTAKR